MRGGEAAAAAAPAATGGGLSGAELLAQVTQIKEEANGRFKAGERTAACAEYARGLALLAEASGGEEADRLAALELATACEQAIRVHSRDRLRVTRLKDAATLFEFVASGLLHAADRASMEAEATIVAAASMEAAAHTEASEAETEALAPPAAWMEAEAEGERPAEASAPPVAPKADPTATATEMFAAAVSAAEEARPRTLAAEH